MAESTLSASKRQGSKKQPKRRVSRASRPKPHPDFPLFWHHSGRWAKKIRAHLHYFGKVETDPKGEAALELWNDQKDDLLAGRKPRKKGEGLTIRDLCNRFLSAKDDQLETGEITARTRKDYESATDRIISVFGKTRLVDDLTADEFAGLRKNIAKTRGLVSLSNEIQRCRSVFKFAYDNGLIDRPVRFGSVFNKPTKKVLRIERNGKAKRMLEAADIRALLDVAGAQLRAMILLGINCGFGNSDCGNLPIRAIDLERGWVDYPRPKTGIERRAHLWPETIAALREVLEKRPAPKDEKDAELVFITKYGDSWAKETGDNPISKEVVKLLTAIDVYECKCGRRTVHKREEMGIKCPSCSKKLATPKQSGIHRKGLSFYALRHSFETIGGESRDQVAVNYIMGHCDPTMADHYRHGISNERLRAVSDHVRSWLFGAEGGTNG